jgi:hypothetical protein
VSTIYSPHNEAKKHVGTLVGAVTACVVLVVAVAAVAGFAFGRHSISHVTPSASGHTVAPTNPVTPRPDASSVPSGATAAINRYETQNGPGVGKWVIGSSQVSKVNPKYVLFRIGPAKGFEDSVQGGYGFALDSGASWSVIGFGSAQVGCPMNGSHAAVVPSPVLAEFGLGCPSS